MQSPKVPEGKSVIDAAPARPEGARLARAGIAGIAGIAGAAPATGARRSYSAMPSATKTTPHASTTTSRARMG